MTFKRITRKIFHKNFLILSIMLSVCTNALCGGALDRKLSLDDLHMVQNQRPENIFPHWIKIGILLHVQPPVLNEIAAQYTGQLSWTTQMVNRIHHKQQYAAIYRARVGDSDRCILWRSMSIGR